MSIKNKHEKLKIKIEKDDETIHTLEYYIGDPIGLIKQVFSSLNPKTIKNLSPDFLKDSTIREIEEMCLNELLGISSKRLKSIISATKCPTDTESSESDIEKVEEHVSLEEISSDSGNENPKNSKKRNSAKRKKGNIENLNKTKDSNGTEKISVLELLELQARARAIRSQLAQEPVAKIEVNSEESDEEKPVENKTKLVVHRTKKDKLKDAPQTHTIVNGISTANPSTSLENRPRKIKLKRNFRKRSVDSTDQNDHHVQPKEISKNSEKEIVVEANKQVNDENLLDVTNKKEEQNSLKLQQGRSESPDVLTIAPNYEVLCISDSDENDEDKIDRNKNSSINVSEGKVENSERKEIEDGEIIDSQNNNTNLESTVNDVSKETSNESDMSKVDNEKKSEKEIEKDDDIGKTECDVVSNNQINPSLNVPNSETNNNENVENESDSSDEDQHDIISLGDEDFDYEMHDPIDTKPVVTKIEKTESSKERFDESTDFIELHDSSEDDDEPEDNQQDHSWNSRWLKSNKVNKILAVSKLGNRVRHKIKQNKQSEQQKQLELQHQQQKEFEEQEAKKKSKMDYLSKFDEGSVQLYSEIQKRSNKKK